MDIPEELTTTLASKVCGLPHQPPQVELGATQSNSGVSMAGDGPVILISIDMSDYVVRLLDCNNLLLESVLSSN